MEWCNSVTAGESGVWENSIRRGFDHNTSDQQEILKFVSKNDNIVPPLTQFLEGEEEVVSVVSVNKSQYPTKKLVPPQPSIDWCSRRIVSDPPNVYFARTYAKENGWRSSHRTRNASRNLKDTGTGSLRPRPSTKCGSGVDPLHTDTQTRRLFFKRLCV